MMDMVEKVARAIYGDNEPESREVAKSAIEAILDSVDYEKGDKGNLPSECYADMFFEIVEALK